METHFKLPWREKVAMLLRFLRGNLGFMIATVLCSCVSMVFHAMTPQIIGLTVDSVLGDEAPEATAWLLRIIPLESLRADPIRALWAAAIAVVIAEGIYCLFTYGRRITLARGSEGFVKALRDGLYSHIQRLSFDWHTAHATGDIIQRCTSDVDVIRTFV